MGVPKAKTKKKKRPSDKLSTNQVIIMTNYLSIASTLLTLWAVYGVQERSKAEEFIESYCVFLQEVANKRNTINGVIEDCKSLTGFDAIKIIDNIFENKK